MVGKAQSEAQSATSATSAIAEIALQTKVFKICWALIALRFQFLFFFFRLIAQFYILNLILFHFDRNIDECRRFLANYLLFFCLKSQNCVVGIVL